MQCYCSVIRGIGGKKPQTQTKKTQNKNQKNPKTPNKQKTQTKPETWSERKKPYRMIPAAYSVVVSILLTPLVFL